MLSFHTHLNSLVHVAVILKCNTCIAFPVKLLRECHRTTELHWRYIDIDSGNGLMPSGNKPLPIPKLPQVLWCHMMSPGANELISWIFHTTKQYANFQIFSNLASGSAALLLNARTLAKSRSNLRSYLNSDQEVYKPLRSYGETININNHNYYCAASVRDLCIL